jgi:hypothetical protein
MAAADIIKIRMISALRLCHMSTRDLLGLGVTLMDRNSGMVVVNRWISRGDYRPIWSSLPVLFLVYLCILIPKSQHG